jgi:hypothetical protein
MGIKDQTELVAVLVTDQYAVFETHGSEGRRTLMAVTCLPAELHEFNRVLSAQPFGVHAIHHVWLRFLEQGHGLACGLRISSSGSRHEVSVPLCEETYAGLEFVLRQFALDPELVPDMPASVLDVTANQSFQRTAFGSC